MMITPRTAMITTNQVVWLSGQMHLTFW